MEIGHFSVLEHDGVIVGCAALYPFPDDRSAEFACLAVAGDYREAGYGEELLKACEERARSLRVKRMSPRSDATTRSRSSAILQFGQRSK